MIEEAYSHEAGRVIRRTSAGSYRGITHLPDPGGEGDARERWFHSSKRNRPEPVGSIGGRFRIADLFSGAGGFGFGAFEAALSVGLEPISSAAIDLDEDALEIYERNMDCGYVVRNDVSLLVDFKVHGRGSDARLDYRPEIIDSKFAARMMGINLLIAGPPCQGHSNLNNHTRRQDIRNLHYLAVPAIAAAVDAPIVIIENVPDVLNDRHSVVESAISVLLNEGYSVTHGVLAAMDFGVPQTRRRFFLVAVRDGRSRRSDGLADLTRAIGEPVRPISDVLGDLLGTVGCTPLHSAAKLSKENVERVDYLFENDEYDLPDHVRPDCHKNGHTYKSVYGRLKWEEPSGTITSGFLTPGRGRFVHPLERRGLTPHEGARIQGFPDTFHFRARNGSVPAKATLAKVIGDAVPPRLGHVVTLAALALHSNSTASIGTNHPAAEVAA